MATTSIWRVGGWLGKVVIYVENPDKTENPAVYEKTDMEGRSPGPEAAAAGLPRFQT